jgi:hypothetical protein
MKIKVQTKNRVEGTGLFRFFDVTSKIITLFFEYRE